MCELLGISCTIYLQLIHLQQFIISLIQITATMKEEMQSSLLTYSHLDEELGPNGTQIASSYRRGQNQSDLRPQLFGNYEDFVADQLQSAQLSQANYQSLNYGQKITVSHNILKGLVQMLDKKFSANSTSNKQICEKTAELSYRREKPKQASERKSGAQHKMEQKMAEVRERLASIVNFIDAQIGGKAAEGRQKLAFLDQVKEHISQNTTPPRNQPRNKNNSAVTQRQQNTQQYQIQTQPKIVIDSYKLHNAKQVYSTQMLSNFPFQQQTLEAKEHMKCSLDRISEALSGESVGVTSNRISKLNQNVSQVKSEPPRAEISFNLQPENMGELDQTGRIILSTINKKTVSTTTIPKNGEKHGNQSEEQKLDAVQHKKQNENAASKVRKSKFWKDKAMVFANRKDSSAGKPQTKLNLIQDGQKTNKETKQQALHQPNLRNNTSNKQIRNLNASNQCYPLTINYPKPLIRRNHTLKSFQKPPFQSFYGFKIKQHLQERPVPYPNMKESNIIQTLGKQNNSFIPAQEPTNSPQNFNPESASILMRRPATAQQNNSSQKRQQIRINLAPQPSNRPQSLPSHLNTSINQNSQLFRISLPANQQSIAINHQKAVIMIPRALVKSNIPSSLHFLSNERQMHLSKNPMPYQQIPSINRSLPVFPNPIKNMNQTTTIQIYQQTDPQRLINPTNKRYPLSANQRQLQKIIELSQQSIQNSIRKDNRSEHSMETNSQKLHTSTANYLISSNSKPLKKRGIQLTSKELANAYQLQ